MRPTATDEERDRFAAGRYSLRQYGWRLHAGIVAWALVAAGLGILFPGWHEAIVVGGGVIGIAILRLRRYWHTVWFWLMMAGMAVLQIPLMIAARPYMDRFKVLFMLPLAVVDFFLVALVVNWVGLRREGV